MLAVVVTLAGGTVAPAPWVGPVAGAAPDEVVPGAGRATNYASDGGGNCSFPPGRNGNMNVALSEVEYGMADACGAWLDVSGPNGTVRVEVTNRCPECPVGHLDLSREAFAAIAPLEAGVVDVTYAVVVDPPVAEPLALRVKEGSNQWWMQVQVIDHGNQVASVELADGAGGWRSLGHSQDNFWTATEPGPGPGPFTIRVTDVRGHQVTVDGVTLTPNQVQRTGARLYGPGSGSAPAVPPAPPTAPPTTATPTTAPTTTMPPPTTTATTVALATTADERGVARAAPTLDRASSPGPDGGGRSWLGPAAVVALMTGAIAAAVVAATARRRRTRRPVPDPAAAPHPATAPWRGHEAEATAGGQGRRADRL